MDHTILLKHLHTSFGLNGTVFSWFHLYLDQCRQHMHYHSEQSAPFVVQFSVPQGSVLGLLLFVMHTANVISIVEHHDLLAH